MNIPDNFPSDGCSFRRFKKIGRWMGSHRYVEYCREHDFLRRYRVVHFLKADGLLAVRIFSDGWPGKLRAPFYFLAVVVTYPWARKYHKPLPPEYEPYADYYQAIL